MAETFTPPTNTSYSPVFTLVRDWLGLAGLGADAKALDAVARNIAADMCERDLAPAAYGDKRRAYYTHAAIGCDGVSVNLCFRDGSADFVFAEEELEITREDGRDIYTAHVPASEILALRQALIDYLPAAEEVQDRAVPAEPFQARVRPWLMACFGETIAGDREERNHRFLEEALELVQACGCTAADAHQLVDYVFARPAGEKGQEVGGVMTTLAALCLAQDLDLHQQAEIELARIWTKIEQIRAKQADKPKHSPLPQHPPASFTEGEVEEASTASTDAGNVSSYTPPVYTSEGLVWGGRTFRDPLSVPRSKVGEPPCGECHLRPGETCDICGAQQPTDLAQGEAAR